MSEVTEPGTASAVEAPLAQRAAALAAAVVAVVGVLAIATHSGIIGSGSDAARLELSGRAVLEVGDERRTVRDGTHELRPGTTVEVVGGAGVVRLPDGATIELREARGPADDSRVRVGQALSLLAGDALVDTDEQTLEVAAGGTTLTFAPGSAGRLGRSTGVDVATYRGAVGLSSGGRTLDGGVPALRQAAVPDTGLLPRRPDPIAIAAQPDPWDRRHLGDAIELGEQLDRRSAGFTASVRGEARSTASLVIGALPQLAGEPGVTPAAFDDGRSSGEHLVAAGIALVAEDGPFADRWRAALSFRDEGAAWGIVAMDQDVTRGPLLALLDGAVDRSPVLFASLPTGTAVDPTLLDPPPPPSGDAPPPDDGTPPDPGDPDPEPPRPPRATDPLEPVTEPLEPVTDPILEPLEPVVDPVDELLGGVLEPVAPTEGSAPADTVGETVDETVGIVDETVGAVDGLLGGG